MGINRTWGFLVNIYNKFLGFLNKNIESDFVRGLLFLIAWALIIGIPLLIIGLSIPISPIYLDKWVGLVILIILILIGFILKVGKSLKKGKSIVKKK